MLEPNDVILIGGQQYCVEHVNECRAYCRGPNRTLDISPHSMVDFVSRGKSKENDSMKKTAKPKHDHAADATERERLRKAGEVKAGRIIVPAGPALAATPTIGNARIVAIVPVYKASLRLQLDGFNEDDPKTFIDLMPWYARPAERAAERLRAIAVLSRALGLSKA